MSLKNPVSPPGIDHGTVRQVAQHLNNNATPGPKCKWKEFQKTSSFVTVFIDKKRDFFRIKEKRMRDSKRLWPLQGT
jgi:hypothetical protein